MIMTTNAKKYGAVNGYQNNSSGQAIEIIEYLGNVPNKGMPETK